MAGIKSLAKDTAVYGVSSIVGRFLNWCLVPLYTNVFSSEQYGIVTYLYAIVALAMIVLTYGMETGFFRFANHERYNDSNEVYSTSLTSLGFTSTLFFALILIFLTPVSRALDCADHPSYVWMMALAVAIDAYSAIPFAYLRFKNRAMRFATLKLINIGINIGLNLFFILLCPWLMKVAPQTIDWFFVDGYGIGYIFLANLLASIITLAMLLPDTVRVALRFNFGLLKEMLRYSFPLLILGIAGIMNQTIDKLLLPELVADKAEGMAQLGIYGANYKIAIIMVMFLQAFRFAYEPFIFSQNRNKGVEKVQSYADAMKYFFIFALIIFLGVMFYLPILRYFIAPAYFSGLKVVPVIMIAELAFGVFFNLSLWYKLTDRTIWGTWFSLMGLAITIVGNVILVPHIGYMGCAWAALACYFTMAVVSYFIGRTRFPIPYQTGRMGGYLLVAGVFYWLGMMIDTPWLAFTLSLRTILIVIFIVAVVYRENIRLPKLKRRHL
ncbi:MAG: oligosaccharide flippase family protein [Muribaculum sp.]|nr:oligosaccharide flippase family protein [Muribaculaceae bacterium]MCM1081196.1 oligosaccharide flippase family protein [Muribaculum sp.]